MKIVFIEKRQGHEEDAHFVADAEPEPPQHPDPPHKWESGPIPMEDRARWKSEQEKYES